MKRARLTALALAAGLLFAPAAKADPVSLIAAAVAAIGSLSAATIIQIGLVAYTAYSSISARSKAKRAAASARAAYNAGLTDRNVTALNADPAWRVIYGRCETGGDVVSMFTSDKALPGGGVKPDAYKHLVIVWSARQCQAIHDIKIDGVSIGALDGANSATGSDWASADQQQIKAAEAGGSARSMSVPGAVSVLAVVLEYFDSGEGGGAERLPVPQGGANGWSLSGSTLTLPNSIVRGYDSDGNAIMLEPAAPYVWQVEYLVSAADAAAGLGNVVSAGSSVRVVHHLGDPDQAVDATLHALLPTQWTANHRLRGRCYSVITLDLERSQFQAGPPGVTADISGALILDPRTGLRAWSDNPALCAYDYLLDVAGFGVTAAEVDEASVIAAANACDVTTSFTTGAVTTSGARYTCNGLFKASAAKEAILLDICESMAGWASYGGNWRIIAGSWSPAVMDLTDADLHGSINIVQAGEPSSELFNSVRGQYIPSGSAVAADVEPYSNATFVTADGRKLWTDVELPFTNQKARAKNLCRIKVEQSRNGLVIFFPAKLRAWRLQTGDRVTVTSAEYGFSAKIFRVTDWQFGLRSPVGLTLQEDNAEAYDEADAAVADPTPNTNLPNPWIVPALASCTAFSGTAELQKLGDGTIISRVKLIWPRSTAAYMQSGRIEITWHEPGSAVTQTVGAAGDSTEAYLTGVRDGSVIVIGLTAINSQRARSPTLWLSHVVTGKTQPPAIVAGLTAVVVPGAVRIAWTPSAEPDYAETQLRVGASWAAGTALPRIGPASSYDWLWPALGNYTIWAKHVDGTGNASAAVSVGVNVTAAAIYVPGGSVTPDAGWLNSNVGLPRGQALNANPECSLASAWNAPVLLTGQPVPGGTAIANTPGVGVELWSTTTSPISGDRDYAIVVTAWETIAASSGASAIMYLAFVFFDAAGAPMHYVQPGSWPEGGTYVYFGRVGQHPEAIPTTYSCRIGPNTGFTIPSGAKSVRLGALANYNARPGAQHAVTDFRIEDITDVLAAAKTANWLGVNGRPTNFLVRSSGYTASPPADWSWVGLRNLDTGASIRTTGRSWGYAELNRAGIAVSGGSYDVYGNGAITGGAGGEALRDALNACGRGNIVVLMTYDEPRQNLWETPGLVNAMCGVGASKAQLNRVAGQGAYCMVGISGSKEGGGSEVVSIGGADAWCEIAFSLFNGALNVSGNNGGAKSVKDLDYLGDLDATRGAPAGTYVGSNLAQDMETLAGATAKANAAAVTAVNAAAIAAQTKADLAELNAKAHADGIVDAEEARAIADATTKANAAQAAAEAAAAADATAKANVAATLANWTGVTGRPYDFDQDSEPSPATPGSTWRVPSTGRTYRLIGGVWVPFVGIGSVGTGEIAIGAATGISVTQVAGPVTVTGLSHIPNGYGYMTQIAALTITPTPGLTASVDLLVTATGNWSISTVSSGDGVQAVLGDSAVFDGWQVQSLLEETVPAGASRGGSFFMSKRFSKPGNTSLTLGLWAQTINGESCILTEVELRVETIRR
ncbi:MAG: hypothetical protein IV107_24175 [Paucibacter sp.]|nr:hypothetical protein [Roseateles sp.]